jgi:uncharacterized phage protein gp47/JayE
MAYPRPSLTEIIDRTVADMASRVVGVDGAVLRRSVLGVIARSLAGASHELHGHLDYIARQVIIDTADGELLERWANVWGVRRKPAEFAVGSVTFTGTPGSDIPVGTILQRQDGARFDTTAAGRIPSGGSVTVAVRAEEAGSAGNTAAAITLTMQQPISGVQVSAATAAGGISAGSDAEADEPLRERLLSRIQEPPQGGAAADYVNWALEVPGVTRAWVYPQEMGLGTVTVRFVRDDDEDIIPDETEVQAVQDYIDARRPVTADLYVVAPTPVPLDMTIQLEPASSAVEAAVLAEVRDLIRREAVPGGTILISHLREAVSTAAGEYDSNIVTPSGNVEHDTGEIAVPGEITFEAIP